MPGTSSNPVILDHYQNIIEVGWPGNYLALSAPFNTTIFGTISPLGGICSGPYKLHPEGIELAIAYRMTAQFGYGSPPNFSINAENPLRRTVLKGTGNVWNKTLSVDIADLPDGVDTSYPAWSVFTIPGLWYELIGSGDLEDQVKIPGTTDKFFSGVKSAQLNLGAVNLPGGVDCYAPFPDDPTPGRGRIGSLLPSNWEAIRDDRNQWTSVTQHTLDYSSVVATDVNNSEIKYDVVGLGTAPGSGNETRPTTLYILFKKRDAGG